MINLIDKNEPIEVLDQDDLLQRCMGNRPFALKIVHAFARQLAADLDELDAAIASEDVTQAGVIAHRIKGASSNVSARKLYRIAGIIGEAATVFDLEHIRICGEAIREEQTRFIESTSQI